MGFSEVSELKESTIEIIQTEPQKENILGKSKQSLRNLWDSIKLSNTHENWAEKKLKKMVESLLNFMKNTDLLI